MLCCLNPNCSHPQNHESTKFCPECGTSLVLLKNRYRPIQHLGGGGFSQTYLAADLDKLNEHCVIKQFVPQVQGTAALEKATALFEQEAKRLQQLGSHPQIPTLFAYCEQDRRLYLVQQYIPGKTLLQELASQGAFSESKIKELLIDLLEILQFIHQHHVIHRDIKPANIMRRSRSGDPGESSTQPLPPGARGDLVLIDFGVSKQSTGTSNTLLGTVIGTFGYAPKEQIEMGKADPTSDLYSLGATCFHLLTGISPYQLWHTEGGDRWVDNWQRHLPAPLSGKLTKIIDKLLQSEPENRYSSAAAVLADLNGKKLKSSIQKLKFKPIWLLGIAPVLLLVLTQAYGYFKYNLSPFSQIFIVTIIQNLSRQQAQLSVTDRWISALATSPDGEILISGDADSNIKLWDLKTGKLKTTLTGDNFPVNSLAVSPDYQILASTTHDGKLKIWNLKTSQLKREMAGATYPFNKLIFSPDGQTIASANTDNAIEIWNWQTGKLKYTLKDHTDLINSLLISSNGETLFSGSADNSIKIWDLTTGELETTLVGHTAAVNCLAISPDGQTLASGSSDNTIKLWNWPAGELKTTLAGHTGAINSLAISADGQTLASGSSDNTIKLWNLNTGASENTLIGHNRTVAFLSVSPDGKTLVSGSYDGQIKTWYFP